MDIPRLLSMKKYWRQHPPTHQLLAVHVGYKPPAEAEQGNVDELLKTFPIQGTKP